MNSMYVSTERRGHTLREIFSQPQCWRQCLAELAASEDLIAASRLAKSATEWLLVGCGSSYYAAMAAASTLVHLGLSARAVPASEILLYPDLVMAPGREYIAVVISRSGLTSEVLRATRMLECDRNIRTIAITCAKEQPLESLASVTLKLPAADERSTVMTRSFTSMLLGLQYFGGIISENPGFCAALLKLPEQLLPLLRDVPARLEQFVESRSYADYVFLAQGPLFGIANEAMLKVMETSCSYAQVFHTLEFRHGPKSIAGPDTLIVFFMSESSYESEWEVLNEMKQLGSSILAVSNRVDARVRQAADFFVELGLDTTEGAQPAACIVWGQLIGVYAGLKKALNPDSPKNLSRVVVLDRGD
jgi:glucosamine--fructose-6-phosphate aminotransferase (isomerizing)